MALTVSPHLSSGTPMTAASATAGWASRAFSTSAGIDVLAAGHDHVLDPVVEEEVAPRRQPSGVAGAEPAVLGEDRRRLLGLVPVAEHVLVRAGPHLAHRTGRERLAGVGVDDPQLDVVEGPAGRAQQVGPGAVGVVVVGHQRGDGPGGLGEPVDLGEVAAEGAPSTAPARPR